MSVGDDDRDFFYAKGREDMRKEMTPQLVAASVLLARVLVYVDAGVKLPENVRHDVREFLRTAPGSLEAVEKALDGFSEALRRHLARSKP